MLTMPRGPDIAPYHGGQIAILNREEWGAWLDPSVSARTILKPLPPGSLAVQQVGKILRFASYRPFRSAVPTQSRPVHALASL
jgi:putative SOS response-associated peptidase YedK